MNEKKTLIADFPGRIDVVLSKALGLSRNQVSKEIVLGAVTIDGKPIDHASVSVKVGQTLVYTPITQERKPIAKPDESIVLDYVYKDDDIAIINKPRGMVVHPAPGHQNDTLVNHLFDTDSDFDFDPEDTENIRPGIVHRLDKDTSGLLAVAMNPESQKNLQDEIRERDFHRLYLALVYGNVTDKKFKIDAPLTRPNHTERKAVVDVYKGREAITHCVLLGNNGKVSLLQVSLETGRTHQIRAHLAYIGYPVVGDPLYGRKEDKVARQGQCLHAYELSLIHPSTLKRMTFYAPIDSYFKEMLRYFFK
jgi:23S rRNA pseudouridine1911/1915/1917 synthase